MIKKLKKGIHSIYSGDNLRERARYRINLISLPKHSIIRLNSNLSCRVVFLKYLSIKWNSSV